MGRENAYKVRDKLGVKRMVERGLWQYCMVDEIFLVGVVTVGIVTTVN